MKDLRIRNARFLAPAFVALLAGCSGAPSPAIPVTGPTGSIARLEGSWAGDYRLADGSRRGSITFALAAGDSSATGNVIMVPNRAAPSPAAGSAPTPDQLGKPATEGPLEVSFIRVQSDRVRGTLRPYTDPDCGCEVQTTFEGKHEGDRIEGTFTIRPTASGAAAPVRSGQWSVQRKN